MNLRTCALAAGVALAVLAGAGAASAHVRVFACEPEWAALAQEIGKDLVGVYSATTGLQDPHTIQARPSYLGRMHNSDLVLCTGVELEVGWLPLLIINASNPRVQPGTPGYMLAGEHVHLLDVNPYANRSMGDVHAGGNHHLVTDPRNIATVAKVLTQHLQELDPANTERYQAQYEAFARRWEQATQRWQAQAAPLKGVPIVVQHRTWSYLVEWLGINVVAPLEPKPGIPPSTGHLNEVLARLRLQPARMVVRAAFENPAPSEWVSEHAHLPVVVLPYTVGGSPQARDLFSLFDETVRLLVQAAQQPAPAEQPQG